MLFKNFNILPGQRAIVLLDGQLHAILPSGSHTVWYGLKRCEVYFDNVENLNVQWDGVASAVRFEREKAEVCWQIVDANDGFVTLAWHRYLTPQRISGGESRAFWRPDEGDIQLHSLAKDEYWLPEHVQAALLSHQNLGDGLQRFAVKPREHLLVLLRGELVRVLGEGEYVLHLPEDGIVQTLLLPAADTLEVDWDGMERVLQFQRAEAEQHWHVVASPEDKVTVVWHKDLPPQVVAAGQARAFWRPQEGEIQSCVLAKDEYWLPEHVQAALLNRNDMYPPLMRHTVRANEKALLTVRDRLVRVLGEGEYVLYWADEFLDIKVSDTQSPLFADKKSLNLWAAQQPELVAEHFQAVKAGENELLLWQTDGVVRGWVSPSETVWFWRHHALKFTFEHIDLTKGLQIDADVCAKLDAAADAGVDFSRIVHRVDVPPQHEGLVYIDRRLQPVLTQGVYRYWQLHRRIDSHVADLRRQSCEINGQELLTEDKLTVRVNAVCNYRISDAAVWLGQHSDPDAFLYRELQFAVRAVVGGKNMDALLADKQAVDAELAQQMRDKGLNGIEIEGAGIKDIILPGEIRTLLTQVVEAEKSAQANNIRRREETAATRSLLNTARVMEENPTALRLKELETLEKVTEKIDKISVYGGLDGVLKGLINIQNPK